MPKAPVHLDDFSKPRKHEVRPSWQVAPVEPESVPGRMNKPADEYLGLGVLRPDPAHVGATTLPADLVHDVVLNGQIERQVRNIAQSFAHDHRLQEHCGVVEALFPDGGFKFRQSKMVHAVYLAGANGDGCEPTRQRLPSDYNHVRKSPLAVLNEV